MRSSRSRILAVALVGLTAASLAGAQQPPTAPRRPMPPNAGTPPQSPPVAPRMQARRGPGGPDGPGLAAGAPGRPRGPRGRGHPAAMLLAFRQQLELTDDQVKRLQALQGTAKPKAMAADQLRARADLMDAMQGDGNLSAARTALDKMSRLRNDQMIERLKARQDARAVLTPAQRTKLDNVRSQGGRRSAALGGRRGQGRPQAGRENFRQGGQGRGMQRPGMMGPGMRGPGMGGQMGPGMAPRGRRGGEAADTRSR